MREHDRLPGERRLQEGRVELDRFVGTVVVGVDGSAGGDAALRWSLAEARMRASRVRVVHAYQSPQLPLTEAMLAAGMVAPAISTEDAEKLREVVENGARSLIECGPPARPR